MKSNNNTFTIEPYRVESQGTTQRHDFGNFYEFDVVGAYMRLLTKRLIDVFPISNHVVNKVNNQTFIETKNPPATTDVYVKPGEYHVNLFS